ncbi:MAG: hypothetical protein GXY48_04915 [Methanomicrobiales archaeon]|nr:hypothetical protein [Methanomicrobiales archaeon]
MEQVYQVRFSECEYSIGHGTNAKNKEQVRQLLGEMVRTCDQKNTR